MQRFYFYNFTQVTKRDLNNNVRVSCRCSDCRIFSTHLKDNFALFIRFRTLYRTTTHGDEEAFVLSYHTSMMMKDERDQSIDVGGLLVGFHRCPVSPWAIGRGKDGRSRSPGARATSARPASSRQRHAKNMPPWRATSSDEEERMRGAPWLKAARLSTSSGSRQAADVAPSMT